MNFLGILAGVFASLCSIVLWLALVNEVCKEVYPTEKPSVPLKTLEAWALRRRQQQDAEGSHHAGRQRKHVSV